MRTWNHMHLAENRGRGRNARDTHAAAIDVTLLTCALDTRYARDAEPARGSSTRQLVRYFYNRGSSDIDQRLA